MGCKAEGAAQGYTVLGGIVLLIYAIQRIFAGSGNIGTLQGLIEVFLGIAVIIMVVLAFDASGFVTWKVKRSGLLLALFGIFIILIVSYPGITIDPIALLSSLPTLAGFMIFLAGVLIVVKK
ncbi:hypothetical protein E4H12_04865 [Candidatus Thorarchaeota archaeon]|nr:MAG: hypothetical protein E4H12_04865 [Candidatus Thorarchaeota archaeon]